MYIYVCVSVYVLGMYFDIHAVRKKILESS